MPGAIADSGLTVSVGPLIAPCTPHIAAELWERRHPGAPSVHAQSWPVADAALAALDTVTLIVQVNGKVRDKLEVDPGIDEAEAERLALASDAVQRALDGATPKKVIVVPNRIVNIVA